MIKKMLVLVIVFSTNILFSAEPQCLATGDYYNVMKNSTVSYNIKVTEGNLPIDPEKFVDFLYPLKEKHIKFPKVIKDKYGNSKLVSFKFNNSALNLYKKGLSAYKSKNYKKAIDIFNKSLEIDKNIYISYLKISDCYLKLGLINKAIENLKIASKLNENDYQCHFKLGKALIKKGDFKKGINSIVNSLVLKPRDENVMKFLKSIEQKKRIVLFDISLKPKAFIENEGNSVNIYFSKDLDQGIWYPYAITKAVWMFEPEYKVAGLNEKWYLKPEKCAFENTLFYYFNQMNMKKLMPDNKLDRLVKIQESQQLEEYMYYTAGSRVYEDIMLTKSKRFKGKMKSFLYRYLVQLR